MRGVIPYNIHYIGKGVKVVRIFNDRKPNVSKDFNHVFGGEGA
jgi:hypothetical protein